MSFIYTQASLVSVLHSAHISLLIATLVYPRQIPTRYEYPNRRAAMRIIPIRILNCPLVSLQDVLNWSYGQEGLYHVDDGEQLVSVWPGPRYTWQIAVYDSCNL